MKRVWSWILAGLAACSAQAQSIGYPTLDTASHWSIQDWGFSPQSGFYVQGAQIPVLVAPNQRQYKSVFYHLSVVGARLNGQEYRLANPDYLGQMEGSTYLVRYASFTLAANLSITLVYYFHDNGEFETYAYFQGAAYVPGSAWDLVMRADYDLGTSGNNIAEFLWSPAGEGGATSPPQFPRGEAADGKLIYQPNPSGPSYWSATSHEIAVAYPPLLHSEGSGIENTGIARILNAAHPQFGMVIWGDPNAASDIVFKDYAYHDGTLNPAANPGTALQLTGEGENRPRYAYAGRDQMLFLNLRVPSDGVVRFRAKVFQRPSTRPLTVRVFQHHPDYLGGWVFDPDLVVRNTADGPRTFRRALTELVGSEDVNIATASQGLPWLAFDGYAGPGQSISDERLHAAITAARSQAPLNLNSARDFQVDLMLVDWNSQNEPGAWENLFDRGGGDVNRIGREGAAVHWPNLGGQGATYQRGQAVLSALHGIGLALNMQPAWSNCPFRGYCWNDPSACGGMRCGSACPPGVSGCEYRAHSCEHECTEGTIMSLTDVNRNLLKFNTSAAQGSNRSEVEWYRRAPEAWVKPGRFGVGLVQGPQLPGFIAN